MSNDLISRSELKKAFDDYSKTNPNLSGIFEVGKFIIDNAPTVIPDIEEFDKALHKWFEEIDEWEKKNGKTRPQGDLISRSEAEKLGATCLAKRNENGQLEAIISLDNAPTVDCIEFNRAKKLIKQAYQKGKDIRPQGDCNNCDFRKFTEKFVDGVVELMNENDITSFEQLSKMLGKGNDND